MSSQVITGKKIADVFYTKCQDGSGFKCNICSDVKKANQLGFTNLKSHIQRVHKDFYDQYCDAVTNNCANEFEFGFPAKTRAINAWLEIVVVNLLPFQIVKNEYFRKHVNCNHISVNTLKKYMTKLTNAVELKISASLPDKFALVFDGWSSKDTHYVSIFATYPSFCSSGYEKVLLGFSPLDDEEALNAENHVDFIKFVLGVFDKSMDNVVCLTGDNCATNLKIAKLVNQLNQFCYFVGCASHRFNLCVEDILAPHKLLVDKVNKLMHKMKNLIPAAKLRRLTSLKPITSCVTRWSSVFHMLCRFQKLSHYINQLNDEDIIDLVPNNRESKSIEDLIGILRDLNSVTKRFQADDNTIADVRAVLDKVISKYPGTKTRLDSSASIVMYPSFESAVSKIQDGLENSLTDVEKSFVSHLLKSSSNGSSDLFTSLPLAEQVMKRRRFSRNAKSAYMDLRFIQPTSNMCERFFSTAGYTLTSRRNRILPSNLESQLFLSINKRFWNIRDVHGVIINDTVADGNDDETDIEGQDEFLSDD